MNKETITIYYNPRCSKCREVAALVTVHGYSTELITYLDTPPSREELSSLLHKLGMKPLALIRKGEAIFKENFAGRTLSEEEWLDALLAYPVLMERPVVVRGNKAVVARPAENVLEIL